jgi:hypothetical protein
MSLSLKAGAVTDGLGNPLAATVTALQRIDSQAPKLALSDTANGLATGQVALRIAFDEQVTGLTASDLILSGARLDSFTQLSATLWQALITPLASAGSPAGVLSPGTSADAQLKGTITAAFASGAGNDAAGNPSKPASLSVPFQIINPNPTPVEGSGNGAESPVRNREPFFTSGGSASISENLPVSTTVYAAQAIDNGRVTYRLTGEDSPLFEVNASTGVVVLKAAADYEVRRSYTFNVVATDDGGLSSVQPVAVSVVDIAEPPQPVALAVDRLSKRLSLTFDRDLGGNLPLDSAFTIKTPIGGQTTINQVTAIQASGNVLTVTLASAFEAGQVDLSYSAPVADRSTTNAAIQSTNGTSGATATGDDAVSFTFVKLADGYIRGASIWLDTNRDGIADVNSGIRSGATGDIFLPPTVGAFSTDRAALIAVGGFNIDTGAVNAVDLKAPPGSTTVNPLTTLVQSVLEVNPGQSTSQAMSLVATSLGLDPSLNLQSYDPIAVLETDGASSNLSGSQLAAFQAQKAAAKVVALNALAVGEGSGAVQAQAAKAAVISSLAAQLIDSASRGEALDLASAPVLGKVVSVAQASGANQTPSDQAKLADALTQIASSTSLDGVRALQASFLDSVAPAAPTALILNSPTNQTLPEVKVVLNVTSTDGTAAVAKDQLSVFAAGVPLAMAVLSANDIERGYALLSPAISLPEGEHVLSASLVDQAGNASPLSGTTRLLIDRTAPKAPIWAAVAGDNQINASELNTLISGSTEPLVSVQIRLVGNSTATRVVQATSSGSFQYALTAEDLAALGQGSSKLFYAAAKDLAGNLGPEQSIGVSVDSIAPQALPSLTSVSDNVGPQQGLLLNGAVTDDQRLSLAGSVSQPPANGELVQLLDGSRVLGTASVSGLSWSFTTPSLSTGSHSISARVIDSAGNVGEASAALSLIVQAEAPTNTALITSTATIGNNSQPTIAGRLAASLGEGERLMIYDGEQLIGDSLAVADPSLGSFNFSLVGGAMSFSFTAPALAPGTHAVTAVIQNAAGNQGSFSASYNFVLDTSAPSFSVEPAIVDNSTLGPGQNLAYTLRASEPVSGLTAADLVVSGGSVVNASFEALSDSLYRVLITPDNASTANLVLSLPAGAASDPAGNASGAAQASAVSVDTLAPAAPAFSMYEGSNAVTADNKISAQERAEGVVLQGSAEANSLITLRFGLADAQATTRSVSTSTSSNGIWSYSLTSADYGFLGQGEGKSVMVRALDSLGNQSAAAVQLFAVDTRAPTLSLIDALRADGSLALSQGAGLPFVNTQRPSLRFSLEAGATAEIDWNGDGIYTNDVDNQHTGVGSAQVIVASAELALGERTVNVRATDALGNQIVRSVQFAIDTTPVSANLTSNPNGTQLLISLSESIDQSGVNALKLADLSLQSADGVSKALGASAQLIANNPVEGRAQSFTLLTASGTLASGDTLSIPAAKLADLAGNVPSASLNLVVPPVDGTPPTLTISSSLGTGSSTIVAGKTATLSYSFSEPVKGLSMSLASASFGGQASGSFGPLVGPEQAIFGGVTSYVYTQTYTPAQGVDARTNLVSVVVATNAFSDLADNRPLASASLSLRVDTRPIAVVDAMKGSAQLSSPVILEGAADGNYLYNIDTDLSAKNANAQISGFGPGDKLVFTVPANATLASLDQIYSIQDGGVLVGAGNVSLYANDGSGAVQRITLVDPIGSSTGLGNSIDSVSELAAYLGPGAIELNKVLVPSSLQLTETAGNDLISANQGTVLSSAKSFNAANGNDTYVINGDVANATANVRITGFGLGDQLLFDVVDTSSGLSSLNAYTVSDNLTDITVYANVSGSVQRIVLVGLTDGGLFSRAALGGSVDSLEELFTFLGQSGPGVI